MNKYEYRTRIYPEMNWLQIQDGLNEMTDEGWELVAVDNNNVYIFKRLKKD